MESTTTGGIDSGSAGTDTGEIDPCDGVFDGTSCGASQICLAGTCVMTECGDGFVDEVNGEQCEDGNAVSGDGCDTNCLWSCNHDSDCDDGNICNGMEACQVSHTCSNPPDLSCDDGNNCTLDTCDAISACEHTLIDADGDGYAWAGLGACGPGTAGGDCNDMNPVIYPGAHDGCGNVGVDDDCDSQIDEDEAGYWYADCDDDNYAAAGAQVVVSCAIPAGGPDACGAGSWTTANPAFTPVDCNDNNANVHPGAFEVIANGQDDDCNGQEICYRDQDDDGYRTDETINTPSTNCAANGYALSTAQLEWANAGAKNLCCDQDPDMHHGQGAWFQRSDDAPPWDGNGACPIGRKWDYDCDGVEEKQYTASVHQCYWEPAGCSRGGDPNTSGWAADDWSPACGTIQFPWNSNCHQNGLTSCTFDVELREQGCH